jgi:excisionase family DNA binding protein
LRGLRAAVHSEALAGAFLRGRLPSAGVPVAAGVAVNVKVNATANGIPVVLEIDEAALAVIAGALPEGAAEAESEFLSVPEAAEFLRCNRQRVYDLLSARRLTRYKDGSRVLVKRAELLDHLKGER